MHTPQASLPGDLDVPEALLLLSLYGANGRWWPPRDARFDRALARAVRAHERVHGRGGAIPTLGARDLETRVARGLARRRIVEPTLEPILPFVFRREYVLLAKDLRTALVLALRDAMLRHSPLDDALAALALLVDEAGLWSRVVPGHERRTAVWRASEIRTAWTQPRGAVTSALLGVVSLSNGVWAEKAVISST